MADTRIQHEVEAWVREHGLPAGYGQEFQPRELRLSAGGMFAFDAVSEEGRIVASISTSKTKTANGRGGTGKLMKLRSDFYFLILADAEQPVVVLTEQDMLDRCLEEEKRVRMPAVIEFHQADLPSPLRSKLTAARKRASREVTPR